MAEPHPLPLPDGEPRPSLAGRALGWRPAAGRRALIVAVLVLSGIALFAAYRATDRDRPSVASRAAEPAIAAEPLSATIAALSRALPDTVRLAEVARGDRLTLIAETTEPDRLRDALAADPALACLRTIGEAALADGGYRVTLEEPAAALGRPPAGPAPDPAHIATLTRQHRLLVERVDGAAGLIVSGREADIRAFAAALESGRPAARLSRWKMAALEDGAVRLDARVEAASRPATVKTGDIRPLFATAAASPIATDAPALAGIVGRLPDDAVALVRGDDGRAVSVAPGQDTPGGWRLEALSADTAVFTRGRERARVPLPPE